MLTYTGSVIPLINRDIEINTEIVEGSGIFKYISDFLRSEGECCGER